MQGNKLVGTLPPELGQLRLLEWLRIFGELLSLPSTQTAVQLLTALCGLVCFCLARGNGSSRWVLCTVLALPCAVSPSPLRPPPPPVMTLSPLLLPT